jgi:nucleoside-diphosphate-sugar epimerase
MRVLVTGAAGFIGSHLCERLLQAGHVVLGIDAFIPYYPRAIKEQNLEPSRQSSRFTFCEADCRFERLEPFLDGVDAVFHLAAMAGLLKSWSEFDLYTSCNLIGTQRLLEAARQFPDLKRLVYASTSSVYGRYGTGDESLPLRPISPYGVTKLAAENLCRAYADEHGVPVVVLRYFSVYGPRQRPDMAYYRFIDALLRGRPLTVCGDGHQLRGNTFVTDCVEATLEALNAPAGETYNVGGGESASVWDVLEKLQALTGRKGVIRREAQRRGDQRTTTADVSKIQRHLRWAPRTALSDGLARQIAWQTEQLHSAGRSGGQSSAPDAGVCDLAIDSR